MGVKDLWNILSPVCNSVSINNLQDETIAIDLSCWVCEGQCVGDKVGPVQPRMYLRNVFFRTHALIMINVRPVFVLDGKAPDLKHAAMAQRNNHRFRRFRKRVVDDEQADNPKKGGRSRFKGIVKQCRDMLELMGVTCLESEGEAEALCGQLSRDGLVDGVITQDSDVFLYGARNVYRNLVIKNGTGTIDAYDMKDVERNLKLTREKMVAMSLLCGCDYEQGVQGVGKEMAFKYLSSCEGNVLDKFRNLRTNTALIKLEEEKNGCIRCCHSGKATDHKKNGCRECFMTKGCSENFSPTAYKNLSEEKKKEVNLELNLRRKAVTDPSFPNQETIDEFLQTEQVLVDFDASWKQPNLCRFINFSSRMLEWEVEYGLEKIFPMLARWILQRPETKDSQQVVPKEIVKKRVLKGVASYELAWSITDPNLTGFLALISETPPETFSSCEPQTLISEALPDLHKAFVDKTENKGRKPAVRRPKKKTGEVTSEGEVVSSSQNSRKDKTEVDSISSSQTVGMDERTETPVDFPAGLKETQTESYSSESSLDYISTRKRNSNEMQKPISPSKIPHLDTFASTDPPLIELSDSDEEVNVFKDEDVASPARKKFSPYDSPGLYKLVCKKNEGAAFMNGKISSSAVSLERKTYDEILDDDIASPARKKNYLEDSVSQTWKKLSMNESPELNDSDDIKNEDCVSPVWKKITPTALSEKHTLAEILDDDTASPARKKLSLNDLEDIKDENSASPVWNKLNHSRELNDSKDIKNDDPVSPVQNKFTPTVPLVEIPDDASPARKKFSLNDFEYQTENSSSPVWNKFSANHSPERNNLAEIIEDASPRIRFSPNDSPELNDFEVWQCTNVHFEPEEPSINQPVKKEEAVNFSLGLESFCNMTIDASRDESGSDSDISVLVENIVSRKRFF